MPTSNCRPKITFNDTMDNINYNCLNINLNQLNNTSFNLNEYLSNKNNGNMNKTRSSYLPENMPQCSRSTYPYVPFANIPTDCQYFVHDKKYIKEDQLYDMECAEYGGNGGNVANKKSKTLPDNFLEAFAADNENTDETNEENEIDIFEACANVLFASSNCKESVKEFLREMLVNNKIDNENRKSQFVINKANLKKKGGKLTKKDCKTMIEAAENAQLNRYDCDQIKEMANLIRTKNFNKDLFAFEQGYDLYNNDGNFTVADYMKKYKHVLDSDREANENIFKVRNERDVDLIGNYDIYKQHMHDLLRHHIKEFTGGNKEKKPSLKDASNRMAKSREHMPIFFYRPFDRRNSITYKSRHPRHERLIGSKISTGLVENYAELLKRPDIRKNNPHARRSILFGEHLINEE